MKAAFGSDVKKTNATTSQMTWPSFLGEMEPMPPGKRGLMSRVFGRPYDRPLYVSILDACALTDDLITLSGGQKARLCLARALYSCGVGGGKERKGGALILLLDDHLSAVGEHLFENAIVGGPRIAMMTRILETHHVLFLLRCDYIVVMDGGRIVTRGTYKDLVRAGMKFAMATDTGGGGPNGGKEAAVTSAAAAAAGEEAVPPARVKELQCR